MRTIYVYIFFFCDNCKSNNTVYRRLINIKYIKLNKNRLLNNISLHGRIKYLYVKNYYF